MVDARQEGSSISSEPLALSRKARRLAESAETTEIPPIAVTQLDYVENAAGELLSPSDVAAQLARQVASARATQPVGRVPGLAGSERPGRHPRRAARRAAAAQAALTAEAQTGSVPAVSAASVDSMAHIAARDAVTGMIAPVIHELPADVTQQIEPVVEPSIVPTLAELDVQLVAPIDTSSSDVDEIAVERVVSDAEPMEDDKRPRRDPGRVAGNSIAATHSNRARWVPRFAMLGAMATVTIALPLIGIMPSEANGAMALEAKDYLATSQLSSGVELLGQSQSYQPVPVLLAADPDGEARSQLEILGDRASRSEERTGLAGCDGIRRDGAENGKLPDSWRCKMWNPSVELRADAAVGLSEINELYRNKFGSDMCLTSGYRTYGQQVALKKQKPYLAATAGKSNHGEGLAVDFCGPLNGFGSVQWNWLKKVAPNYGWDIPEWAQRSGSKPEPWHWEFFGGGAK